MKDLKLTKLEEEILNELIEITDDFGEEVEYAYECLQEDGYDMKVIRGVLSSLEQKDKIYYDEDYWGDKVTRRYIYVNHTINWNE